MNVVEFFLANSIPVTLSFICGIGIGFYVCWRFFVPYHIESKKLEIEQKEKEQNKKDLNSFISSLKPHASGTLIDTSGSLHCPNCLTNTRLKLTIVTINPDGLYECSSCKARFESPSFGSHVSFSSNSSYDPFK